MMNLTVGTEIKYTGDMANEPGFGRIASVRVSRWGTDYEITLDADPSDFGEEYSIPARRFVVSSAAFNPGPGRRFWTMADWRADRSAKLAAALA